MPALDRWLQRGLLNSEFSELGLLDKPSDWTLRIGGDPVAEISEPTDQIPGDASTPYSIAIGGQDTGVINALGDHDWFAVTLTAGQVYIFTLTGSDASPLSDPYLALYNSAGGQVAFNDDASFPTIVDSVLTYTPTVSGTYYLGAQGFEDGVTGDYTITANISTPLDSINWMETMSTTSIDVYFATIGQSFNGETALRSWTAAEVNSAMAALATFSQFTTLTFNHVFSPTGAELVLTLANLDPGVLGYFQVGTPYGFFDPNEAGWTTAGLQQGGYGFVTLIHELGHGLGLAHPHDTGGGSTIMPGVGGAFNFYGTYLLNQGVFTTMGYNDAWPLGPNGTPLLSGLGWQGTPMALDIGMLQQFYGANPTANVGDTTYTLQSTNYSYRAIWDVGGTDTIAYAGSGNATIDLRAATLQYEIGGGGWVSFVNGVSGGFTIANGVVIENATGGNGNDTISGNSAPNQLNGGAGNDTVYGGSGDTLLGGEGNDTLWGGGGVTMLGGGGDDLMQAASGDIIDGGAGLDYVNNIDLSASTTNVIFDGALAMSNAGMWIGGYVIRNIEGYSLLTGSGDDVLSLTAIAGPSGWIAGAGFDRLILDFSAASGGAGFAPGAQLNLFGVEAFTYTGSEGDDGWTGGDFADTLVGNGGNDGLVGRGGNDMLDGGAGNDNIIGGSGDDQLIGGDGADQLSGDAGADTILAGAGDDNVSGGDAGDFVDGGDGNDMILLSFNLEATPFIFNAAAIGTGVTFANGAQVVNFERFELFSGSGDDEVFANQSQAGSIWHAYGGVDRLNLDLSALTTGISTAYSIADPISLAGIRIDVTWSGGNIAARFIEAVSITGGSAGDNLVGHNLADVFDGGAGSDTLVGNGGDDVLNGGADADTMTGGAGDDTYVVDNAGDTVTESSGAGADTVQSSITYALGANLENLTLIGAGAISGFGNGLNNIITGNGAANQLNGFDGNDALDGGAGADNLFGGNGDDAYIVDNSGDQTTEVAALGGVDTVFSSVARNLTANIENLTLTGAAAITGAGNALNNIIIGNAAANTLYGFDGNDRLDGGLGADTLFGANGDDVYVVDDVGDITVEGSPTGGVDTVESSISRNLNANFENLTLTGVAATIGYGNILNNVMTGNAAANALYGFEGADTLDGGAGADSMFGANGDDTYIVDNAADVTSEVSAFGGVDTVISSVTRNLTANLENLTLTGAAAITGAGNALNNVLTGNGAANTLYGLDGADTLDGGLGADTLQGGAGADAYVFSSALGAGNIDAIIGFSVVDDTIRLNTSVFTGLSVGALDASAFHIGASAADADDRVIYNSATGALYFDADGDGAGVAVQFASLAAGLALTNDDFFGVGP